MRFHGFLIVRDEDDILSQCLEHLLTWCDNIFVLDTGSTDATWDIVQDFARRDPRVVPFRKQRMKFFIGLRGWMMEHYRDRLDDGDWIARLDADEFYHIPPPEFVRTRMKPHESRIDLRFYYFRLTDREVAAWEAGEETPADRARPIQERRRHYQLGEWGEGRLFRYRRSMQWPPWCSTPLLGGLTAQHPMPILHYPHRDPDQMVKRYRLRAEQKKFRDHEAFHWAVDDWRKEVVHLDENGAIDASSAGSVHALGDLRIWEPGQPLPDMPAVAQPTGPKAIGKQLMYRTCVRLMDRFQPKFPDPYEPPLMDEPTPNPDEPKPQQPV